MYSRDGRVEKIRQKRIAKIVGSNRTQIGLNRTTKIKILFSTKLCNPFFKKMNYRTILSLFWHKRNRSSPDCIPYLQNNAIYTVPEKMF